MKIYKNTILILIVLFLLSCTEVNRQSSAFSKISNFPIIYEPDLFVTSGTFLGNNSRSFYGINSPDSLCIIWKHALGTGKTVVGRDTMKWSGAGWTGQTLVISEKNETYLIQGAFDHQLKKINAKTGKLIWTYDFDDVIKGTGTFYVNKNALNERTKYIILQGSRQGINNTMNQKVIPSFRAVSYKTGEELWRMNVRRTKSYSRDVDGSALILNDTAYIGLENGIFTIFDPKPEKADTLDGILQPKIYEEHYLFNEADFKTHGGNLVTESSPASIGGYIYISSGSGHLFRYNIKTHKIDSDFFVGSDIDGSAVIGSDSCVYVSVEKQYIKGKGGVYKIKINKDGTTEVKWYFPTGNNDFATWLGGVIGSVGINHKYAMQKNLPALVSFIGIDGYLYVVRSEKLSNEETLDPNEINFCKVPEIVFKYELSPSISTPIFVDNKLIACSYSGIYMFSYDSNLKFQLIKHLDIGPIEATPVVFEKRIYISSKDGNLYCLGNKDYSK